MLESFFHGLWLVVQWPAFGYLLLGILIGLWFGAIPGLGGLTGLVILLPFTFTLDQVSAFALLLGMYAVTAISDTIISVMLGIPGSIASQATVIDGHPMAKRGEASRAFGAAYTVSALGGVFGAAVMAVSLPIALPIILSIGSPEFFLLSTLGLTMVGTVSGSAVTKGLAAALIGLILSQIGYPVAAETPRYTFEIYFLYDGLPLVPLVLGLFAIPELLDLALRNTSIAAAADIKRGGMLEGVKDAFRHRWLALRSAIIGVYIGMLPGLGNSIADWVAYGHAVQSTREKDNPHFGKGDVRGVIAPETATNALKGGELIPTVVLGIPGSGAMAILLGAFLMQGLVPGPEMLLSNINVTFSMVWTLVLANLIGAGIMMFWSRQVAKVAFVNGHFIVPGVLVFVLMGAWMVAPDLGNWMLLLGAGFFGWVMKRCGWPRPALVLGFVLGPIMERSLVLSQQAFSLEQVMTRPIFLILLVLIAAALYFGVKGAFRAVHAGHMSDASEGTGQKPGLSLAFTVMTTAVFVYAMIAALPWTPAARLFPLAIGGTALIVLAFALVTDLRDVRGAILRADGHLLSGLFTGFNRHDLKSVEFMAWVGLTILLVPVVGQITALSVFPILYLLYWGRMKPITALAYGAGTLAVLLILYDRILGIYWMPGLVRSYLG